MEQELTREQLVYLLASICTCYGAVPKNVADHMTEKSFGKYTKSYFVDTMKIGMHMRGYSAKISEFEEKMNDPRFDCLFLPEPKAPAEEVIDPEDLPEGVVIEKEESDDNISTTED